MKSMTGYASGEITSEMTTVSIEVKSYNSKYLDLSVNLPSYINSLEFKINAIIPQYISRGKVEVYVRIKETAVPLTVTCNALAVKEYARAIHDAAVAAGINYSVHSLPLIIAQDGVLKTDRTVDIDRYWNLIEPLLKKILSDYTATRIKEGNALSVDILGMVDRLDSFVMLVRQYIPQMEQNFKQLIRAKFEEMLGNNYDEQRILQETAAMLVKYTINEEIVRLSAHLKSLRTEIEGNPVPGRKIDFICQEINREVNTIGSKNQSLEIGQAVITAKDAVENIREQARNIE